MRNQLAAPRSIGDTQPRVDICGRPTIVVACPNFLTIDRGATQRSRNQNPNNSRRIVANGGFADSISPWDFGVVISLPLRPEIRI